MRPPIIGVVDDDPGVLESLGFLLETEGFDVRTYRSGAALLRAPDQPPVDCFVIDYKMSGLDGITLASRLRGRGSEAPIILITGDPDENIGRRAAAADICAVLHKPHLDESLLAHVRRLTRPDPAGGDLR
ncbi:response regulator transcription factor [Bradyrhizobium sp. WD16]|uniref:response regulator transcription factor n=1 Tax=Bradyrhizobium sp. WD16 TaxID=1521768 RepID=UPI0020A53B25|nr:response regulator [Bradyrhizobium sp. WD16]UTD29812.1 two-component system response regulator [Bradyrhizobium sp. WD16]